MGKNKHNKIPSTTMVETSINKPSQGFATERPFEAQQTFKQAPLMSSNIPQAPPLDSLHKYMSQFYLHDQKHMLQEQNVRYIKEKPVLDKVEKLHRTDVHKKVHILEKRVQDLIEVREMPIQKRFIHPVHQVHINDETKYSVEGKEDAEREIDRLLNELTMKDMNHKVEVKQLNDVFVHEHEPTMQVERELVKHYVITKPIITEIHEQPIEEIHEQRIEKVIYEKPIIRMVRSENVTSEVEQVQKGADFSHIQNLKPTTTSSPLLLKKDETFSSGNPFQQQGTSSEKLLTTFPENKETQRKTFPNQVGFGESLNSEFGKKMNNQPL